DRVALLALERPWRAACAEDRDPRRSCLRRRTLGRAQRRAEAPSDRQGGSGPARGRPGRAQPVAEPRTRDRASRRGAPRGAEGRAQAQADEAERCRQEATPGAEAATWRDEAPAPSAGRRLARFAGVAQGDRLPPRCVDVALRLGLELRLAALAAEVVGVACIRRGRLARTAVDRHPADGIPRAPAERQRDEDAATARKTMFRKVV